ncbi:MAG: hypothetical protein H6825_15270 [Planctomycetes bacterium]|nr:hypothetical protein [Planctomycetota bacterium]
MKTTVPRSSTSNSDARSGFPWAGLAATLIVALLDPLLFQRIVPWDALLERLDRTFFLEAGLARDELAFAELDADPGLVPRVVCAGNSRAGRFARVKDFVGLDLKGALVERFTHAGLEPFELRGLADRLAPYHPDVVVLSISEFDTHRPIRLNTTTAMQSLGALATLVREAGLGFAFAHRDLVLGLTLGALFPAYRYRAVLHVAGLDEYEHFAGVLSSRAPSIEDSPFQLEGEAPLPLAFATFVPKLLAENPQLDGRTVNAQLKQCLSITRGPHVAVRMALLRTAIDEYLAAGAQVIVVEAPVHPSMVPLYRPETREEAHAFLRELDALDGVQVMWLDEIGPFAAADFHDLTHLDDEAGARVGHLVGERIEAILKDR